MLKWKGMERLRKLLKTKTNERNKNIHSEAHYWADVISRAFGEQRKFGMYLGIIKRVGLERAKQIFNEIKESEPKSPGKLFVWKSKKT